MEKSDVFNINTYLNDAEFDYLLEAKKSFEFELRRPPNMKEYYSRLEIELRNYPEIKVTKYRSIKEGFTKISRPSAISFDSEFLTNSRPHLILLRKQIQQIESKYKNFISVLNFVRKNFKESVSSLDNLDSCLDIFHYLISHQHEIRGFLPRHIPHGQSTKLIGKEPLLLRIFLFYIQSKGNSTDSVTWRDFYSYFEIERVKNEFRFFAPSCKIQTHPIFNFNGVFDYESLSQFDFSELKGTLIVENFSSFYALTQLSQNSLIIWGGGFKAVALIPLLAKLPHPIFYWGDIDKEGYEIYGLLKNEYLSIQSILMNEAFLKKHQHLIQKKTPFSGPFKNLFELQSIYEKVSSLGLQIEQEQLDIQWPLQIGSVVIS